MALYQSRQSHEPAGCTVFKSELQALMDPREDEGGLRHTCATFVFNKHDHKTEPP